MAQTDLQGAMFITPTTQSICFAGLSSTFQSNRQLSHLLVFDPVIKLQCVNNAYINMIHRPTEVHVTHQCLFHTLSRQKLKPTKLFSRYKRELLILCNVITYGSCVRALWVVQCRTFTYHIPNSRLFRYFSRVSWHCYDIGCALVTKSTRLIKERKT